MNWPSLASAGDQVEILLSTYNGAKYLDAFLTSLIDQDVDGWSLTVRDDGSSDETLEILKDWRRRLPTKIRLVDESNPTNLGFLRSFSRLMEQSGARYVMFADQDDVWLPAKIRLTFQAMRRQEEQTSANRPIVVHTDANVVDEELRPMGRTAWKSQGRSPERRSTFSRVMIENVVLGCTAMLNRPLIDTIASIPPEAIYHDWWIAMVASAFGDMVALSEPTLLWRRHGGNESEMSNARKVLRQALTNPPILRRRLTHLFDQIRPRVAVFLERYRRRMQPCQIGAAEALLRLPQRGFVGRRLDILRHKLFFSVRLRNWGLIAFL